MHSRALKKVGLIPARGGSKGLPEKNILKVKGKPLIAYTIEAALASHCLDAVMVSTDDEHIAQIALDCGAQVPFVRPANLATDTANDLDVLQHFNDFLIQAGYEVDLVAYLRPTTPLKSGPLIDQCITKLLQNTTLSAIRTVTSAEGVFHPYWAFKEDNGMLSPFVDGISLDKYYQRQLLPDCYRLNGVCDVFRLANLADNSIYGEKMGFVTVPESQAVDIDTKMDLQFFEFLLAHQEQEYNAL